MHRDSVNFCAFLFKSKKCYKSFKETLDILNKNTDSQTTMVQSVEHATAIRKVPGVSGTNFPSAKEICNNREVKRNFATYCDLSVEITQP